MLLKKFGLIALIGGAGLATAACTDGYGYSGVSVGYGGGGYYDDGYGYYGDAGYGGYDNYPGYGYGYGGYGYAPSYYGWNNGYYYPGTGYYVYDRYRRPYRWNDGQRRYWEGRRGYGWRGDRGGHWDHFDRGPRNGDPQAFRDTVGRSLRNDGGNYGDRSRFEGHRGFEGRGQYRDPNFGDRNQFRGSGRQGGFPQSAPSTRGSYTS